MADQDDAHVKAAAYGRALLAYRALGDELGVSLKDYVEGSLRGQVAEAANLAGERLAVFLRAKQDAFEAHVRDELATIKGLVQTLVDESLFDRQRLNTLERDVERHVRRHPRCDECPFGEEPSQIGTTVGL